MKKLLFIYPYFLLLILVVITSGCSAERNNPFSKAYHNTSAHYNGYFLAREKMKEVETTIQKNHIDNFNRILEVFPVLEAGTQKSISAPLDEIIKKASIPIQRHKNSKWVDDSYIVLGKARLYKGELDEAKATFKYVNKISKDKDARHLALIWLMRTFMLTEEYSNVVAVDDVLKKEKLNKNNDRDWRLARAHYFAREKNYEKMEESLGFAIPGIIGREKRARIYYIIGQLRQLRGDESGAYESYRAVLINNPSYELSFYTKLNLAQVTELSAANDVKKIQRYFRKLLRDAKNKEYKDKIYYEMARFELKQDNVGKGVELLQQSVAVSTGNPNQKASSYLKLAEVHYEKLRQFNQAKNYYDSTLTFLDKKSENYKAVQQRQKILAEFVKHYTVVEREDSLQRLAKMDSVSLNAFLDKKIAEEEALLAKAQKDLENGSNSSGTSFDLVGGGFAVNNDAGNNWYFYNPAAIGRGRSEFTRKWGNRPLEDNWRRSKREKNNYQQDPSDQEEEIAENATEERNVGEEMAITEDGKINTDVRKKELLQNIPFTAEQLEASNQQLEEALYNLGKIYTQQLEEPTNAISSFERVLKDYPRSNHRAESLYFLYLIHQQQADSKKEQYKNTLLSEYPTSIYARKIANPNYAQDSKEISQIIKNLYKTSFELYDTNDYTASLGTIQQAKQRYPNNEFEDKFMLLEALISAKTQPVEVYKKSLEDFIENYKTSSLVPYANNLLQACNEFMAGRAKSLSPEVNAEATPTKTPAPYSSNITQPHLFVVVVNQAINQANGTVVKFSDFNMKNFARQNLNCNSVMLTDSSFAVVIKEFADKDQAMSYMAKAKMPKAPLTDIQNSAPFIISTENFPIFYKFRDVKEYMEFFRKNYY